MNTSRFLYLLVLFCVCNSQGLAQSFSDLTNRYEDNGLTDLNYHLFVRYTAVNAKYTESYGGFTLNGSYRVDRIGKGEMSYHFENPTLGDLIWMLFNLEKWNKRKTDQAYGSGFFGWHELYWNAVAKDRLLLSAGVSFGDYIYASTRAPGESPLTRDPAGYFFHIGPAFKTSYLINSDFWVDGIFRYDVGFRAGKPSANDYSEIKGYPRPHFITISGTLNHSPSRIFTNIRVNTLIDRGENKDGGIRFDWSFGLMF